MRGMFQLVIRALALALVLAVVAPATSAQDMAREEVDAVVPEAEDAELQAIKEESQGLMRADTRGATVDAAYQAGVEKELEAIKDQEGQKEALLQAKLSKYIHMAATYKQKFFDQKSRNQALSKHLAVQHEHAAILLETKNTTMTPSVPMNLPSSGDSNVAKCISMPVAPVKTTLPKIKSVQKQLKFHYDELCAGEIKDKAAVKEKQNKQQENMHKKYTITLEKSQKASAYAQEVFTKSKVKEKRGKAISEKKIEVLKESLEKTQEIATKQGSVKEEKTVKVQSQNQEKTTKYVAENSLKEKANKRTCEDKVKGLQEQLSKKKTISDEAKSKIYEKWNKHLAAEKAAKRAEKEAKVAKETFAKAAKTKEVSTKAIAEKKTKGDLAAKTKESAGKEKAKKSSVESGRKESFQKGNIKEQDHKKESLEKEITTKKTAEDNIKESFHKKDAEKASKKTTESHHKKTEGPTKKSAEALTKKSQEHKQKADIAESKIKPELQHKEGVSKEKTSKTATEKQVKTLKADLTEAHEKAAKAVGSTKEKGSKCEASVKSAQRKLEVKYKAMKKQGSEVSTKVEYNVKTERKDKTYMKKEKKEKAYEAGYKWYEKRKSEKAEKSMTAGEASTEKRLKMEAAESLNKKLKKVTDEAATKVKEVKIKQDSDMELKGKDSEKMIKNPFRQAEEMTTKIRKMKEMYFKTKGTDEQKLKKLTNEESTKYESRSKERATKELKDKSEISSKKEGFKKKCDERQSKMEREEKREFGKLENTNKELCTKTRIASEANNKKSVTLWQSTIMKLKAHNKAAGKMEVKRRKVFVKRVCSAIRSDVQSTVSDHYRIKIIKISDHSGDATNSTVF